MVCYHVLSATQKMHFENGFSFPEVAQRTSSFLGFWIYFIIGGLQFASDSRSLGVFA